MPDTPLSNHIYRTYAITRKGMGVIGIVFPVLLWIGGWLLGDLDLQGSMSAYYHAGAGAMRNWFVGLLFAVGIILMLYKGFTPMEDYALNIGGLMGLGVALFPMAWDGYTGAEFALLGATISAHGFCAVTLFLCIAYVCIWRACDTLDLVTDDAQRARYRTTYKYLGWAMIASPVAAFVLSGILRRNDAITYFIELAGIVVFGAYWLVKSSEMTKSGADQKAMRGELEVVDEKKKGLFREIRVRAR